MAMWNMPEIILDKELHNEVEGSNTLHCLDGKHQRETYRES